MEKLIDLCKYFNCKYSEDESMKLHTTFKIGGKARLVIYPENEMQIASFKKCAKEEEIRLITIGNGSNLLVADEGLDACVMILGEDFADIRLVDDKTIYAKAGAKLISVCRFALKNSLTGLEFAYGIPGSCGGAVFMNAGAYDGEVKDVVTMCEHITPDGNISYLNRDDINFGYRQSVYQQNDCVITGVYFKLEAGKKDEIKAKMDDFISRRRNRQPLEYPSAGSTFKRPEGYYAGALIDKCGLKGVSVGAAQVSEKHAGFVINRGGATCKEVLELCNLCAEKVFKETGVKLEMEIKVTK